MSLGDDGVSADHPARVKRHERGSPRILRGWLAGSGQGAYAEAVRIGPGTGEALDLTPRG
jgi:hypothetical protein